MTEEKSHEHTEHHGHTHEHHTEHNKPEHEHHVHHTEHKKPEHETHHEHTKGVSMKKSSMWQIATAIAVILLIASVATGGFKGKDSSSLGSISEEEAAEKAVEYINTYLLQPGTSATLNSVAKSDSGIYTIDISVAGNDYKSYVTQDGKLLFINGVDMDAEVEMPEETETQTQPTPEMTKSDKPEVELFVMAYCPYGTQAEKGIIPAVKALGDNIDFNLRFVYYAMHPTQGEVEEQLNQYCIQAEQNDKFLDYLECFLTEGDRPGCIEAAKVDEAKLASCVEKTDEEFDVTTNLEDESLWLNGRFPKFDIDAELNSKYGVGGSPTLVINGASVSSSRDSASYLRTICAAFNEAPAECETELSSASPSPGFGYTTTSGASTTAQCG